MARPRLGGVSAACRRRLVGHYGSAVHGWLDAAPGVIEEAGSRWRLRLDGYHDAGCACVLAKARTEDNRAVLVKAWYDPSRYRYEVAALRSWPRWRVPALLHTADDLSIATVGAVAGHPGGAARPEREHDLVALAIDDLHNTRDNLDLFPHLDEYVAAVVLPRIDARLRTHSVDIPDRCLDALAHLDLDTRHPVLLHTDLYRENVLFDAAQRPVFIDPLPMVGDPAYDWAFWTVYYALHEDPLPRLRLAQTVGHIPLEDLVPVCLMLCVDGLLYYRQAGDERAPRMVEVMQALLAGNRTGALW